MTLINSYCTEAAFMRTVESSTAIEGVHVKLFRCSDCNKLLAKSNGRGGLAAEIKCPRCGMMNEA